MNKEELVFELYKNAYIGAVRFRSEVKRQFKLSDKQITNLYARINNYQIKKYGQRIGNGKIINKQPKEEWIKDSHNVRTMKRAKLECYETQKIRYKEIKENA